ncbi:phage tail protein [Paenibacillus kandeliae]|uniref:phage tail protein n=1 Tax=Paenibacillus kandeliae TaxID=3231269 RepID=UPI00345A4CDC
MSDQYLGEIRMFAGAGGTRVPAGWSFCDGKLLSVNENQALFALIGNVYGGDGKTTFALPDLRGRVPIHAGTSPKSAMTYNLGSSGGAETATISEIQLPAHTHAVNVVDGSGKATTANPGNTVLPATSLVNFYMTPPATPTVVNMNTASVTTTGGSVAHSNIMPYVTIGFIIALQGIYPTPS